MYKFGEFAALFLLSLAKSILIVLFWKWFVMPVFITVPPLPVFAVMGMLLLIALIRFKIKDIDNLERDRMKKPVYEYIAPVSILYSSLLIIGFIISFFV